MQVLRITEEKPLRKITITCRLCAAVLSAQVGGAAEPAGRSIRFQSKMTSCRRPRRFVRGRFCGWTGSHVVSNAYPVYADKAGQRAAKVIAELRMLKIESIG